jgi:hypothetical protein
MNNAPMNQQSGANKHTNPVMWVIFGVVVLAVAGGIWYVVVQGYGNTNTGGNLSINGANISNSSQIIAGTGQRYESDGISITIPKNWFLSTEISNSNTPFVLSTLRGVTSILGFSDRQGVVVNTILQSPIQEGDLEEFVRTQEADFRTRMPDSPSNIERKNISGKYFWIQITDTLTTFEGEGSYSETYYIPLPNALVELAVTSYGRSAIDPYQEDINTMVLSVR